MGAFRLSAFYIEFTVEQRGRSRLLVVSFKCFSKGTDARRTIGLQLLSDYAFNVVLIDCTDVPLKLAIKDCNYHDLC